MSEQPRSVAEDWRRVRGWVPWLFAGVYFPLYVTLDLVAGGAIADGLGLPRSVGVAGFSLAVALVVTTAVTLSRFESVSLSGGSDALDLGARIGSTERSTVGSAGAVDRKSVRTSQTTTESIDRPAGGSGTTADGGTSDAADATDAAGATGTADATDAAGTTDAAGATDTAEAAGTAEGADAADATEASEATDEDEEWPEEWISGEEL